MFLCISPFKKFVFTQFVALLCCSCFTVRRLWSHLALIFPLDSIKLWFILLRINLKIYSTWHRATRPQLQQVGFPVKRAPHPFSREENAANILRSWQSTDNDSLGLLLANNSFRQNNTMGPHISFCVCITSDCHLPQKPPHNIIF